MLKKNPKAAKPPQRLAAAIDAQAIARIIDAVEAGAWRKFPDIDRAALQRDIELARTHYDEMKILGDKTAGRKLFKKVKQIRNSAQQIVDKMDAEVCQHLDSTNAIIGDVWGDISENIRLAVQHLIKLIDYKPSPDAYTCDPKGLLAWPGSTFEQIAGRYLREVFESHFKIPAGYKSDFVNEEVRGPYIDFAEQALSELKIFNNGVPYMRQSIADALTDTRRKENKSGRFARQINSPA